MWQDKTEVNPDYGSSDIWLCQESNPGPLAAEENFMLYVLPQNPQTEFSQQCMGNKWSRILVWICFHCIMENQCWILSSFKKSWCNKKLLLTARKSGHASKQRRCWCYSLTVHIICWLGIQKLFWLYICIKKIHNLSTFNKFLIQLTSRRHLSGAYVLRFACTRAVRPFISIKTATSLCV